MSGFQSCDSLMSQLPWRDFHLKIIYSTFSKLLQVLQMALLNWHELKNAFIYLFILKKRRLYFILTYFHFARKL